MPGLAPQHPPRRRELSDVGHQREESVTHVHISQQNEDEITMLNRTLSGQFSERTTRVYPESHLALDDFLQKENQELELSGLAPARLGVCFKNVTTWGAGNGASSVKTLGDALLRTLTLQDVYEWTVKRWMFKPRIEGGRPLIRDFSGVVRGGEMMLVLGRPGSGCSTFLRTIANDHASFLGTTGSLDYSGISPAEILKHYRGEVAYVAEDDVHFPTLTVRQTLEFALETKTPKRHRQDIPRYLEIYARVFGISHILETLVGNEYIRGVSGGERKRISIIESLAADSSVAAWDNSTRGLDASSALDYARSLRIMTDTCGKATVVTLYQASDAVFELMDKVLLIDTGRMIYQGPAPQAKKYFEDLGYECQERQTISDFLASVTSPSERRFKPGWEKTAPRGAIELEAAFRSSPTFQVLEESIRKYEMDLSSPTGYDTDSTTKKVDIEGFKNTVQAQKSRYVPSSSSYTTSFVRQVYLCTKRQWWQLKGHMAPLYVKTISTLINSLLIGSMFYKQPATSDGAFSRGGFILYSSILLGWIQLAELEDAVAGRDIVSRQKRYAFVKPSAVGIARVFMDLILVLPQALIYSVIAYFLAGMQMSAGPFFIFVLFIYSITICMTAQFRIFGAMSPSFEVALRYCGVLLMIYIVFGGYFISLDRLMSEVPWFGWIGYILPLTYAYEAMMATEFHNLELSCSPASIIPSGQTYTDVSFQSCAIDGSTAGSLILSGDAYIAEKFGFYYSHVWRNFGILMLFTVVSIAIGAWLSEKMEWSTGSGGAIQFKTMKKSVFIKPKDEEEKGVENISAALPAENGVGQTQKTSSLSESATGKTLFTWDKINYTVPYDGSSKTLLNDVSGYCVPGQMTALVGASGAGKSTLLNTLAQRQSTGTLTGHISMGGHPIGPLFRRQTGFCEQMDIHDESSTIREALEFSALLRQSPTIPREEKLAYVDKVLEMLDLVELQDAIIWSLQIEQKKRTTIGVELCARPSTLLFLDEPTSGLDSQGAYDILLLLRRLTDTGLAILCTIHQASQQHFTSFDRVLAINPGGNTFYFGDIGPSGKTIFDYFGRFGVAIADGQNVADFLIQVGVGIVKSKDELNWNEVWRTSKEALAVQDTIQDSLSHPVPIGNPLGTAESEYSASTLEQIILLTKRVSRQYWRTPEYPYSRLYGSFIHSLLNGFTFFQLGNSITDLQSKMFSCFLILMLVPEFMNATSMRFISNRDIWESREYPSRIYGWVAFSVAQIIPEIPYAIFGASIFYFMLYFPVGLPLGLPAGYTFLMILLFQLFATSWGQWVGALSKDASVAANLMPFMVIMCELFNGVLRPQSEMPVIWKYTMYYITPFTYWIGGLLSMILPANPIVCNQSDLSFFQPPPGQTCGTYSASWLLSASGYIENPEATADCGYCQYSIAEDYLVTLNLSPSKPWPYFGIFFGFTIANLFLVLGFVYLYTVKYLRKKA